MDGRDFGPAGTGHVLRRAGAIVGDFADVLNLQPHLVLGVRSFIMLF